MSLKLSILLLSIFIFFITPSFSKPENITFYGDAYLNNTSITLTKPNPCTTSLPPSSSSLPPFSLGRSFYVNPIRFLDVSSIVSFSTSFTFTISSSPSTCPFGDGFAFLITSKLDLSYSIQQGYIGLPSERGSIGNNDEFYLAVEFDTSFDPDLGDINGNHVGIDFNNVRSLVSVDAVSKGVDLKNGQETTAWIEYKDSEKMIRVWLGYSRDSRPVSPVLAEKIDLSGKFKEFMHVGFTGSNGKGSSVYVVRQWKFKTFSGFYPSSTMLDDDVMVRDGDCLMCSPDIIIRPFHYRESNRRILTLALVFGGFAVVIVLITVIVVYVCVCVVKKKRRLRTIQSERHMRRFHGGRNMVPKMLSLTEIKSATNGFDDNKIIGEGASAVVYEGSIPNCGNVAVKRFNHESKFDTQISRIPFNTEFATMVGCLRHKNLVQLQGWCCERNELVLVYEHMTNGSLDKILHNRTSLTKYLTWERRLNIIRGVASAIVYLHEECESQIIHRDVKTCNILLDAEFNAKLGDFGLAEVYRHSFRARDATVPAGTMGYLAPEYAYSGVPTVKTDVYSFGVVVLEVASGRRPVDEDRVVVTDYVWDLWEKGSISEAADPNLMGRFNREEMERTLMVGLVCAHPNCEKRPTMREASRMIKGECGLPVLPCRKPVVRIQSVLPEGCDEIMSHGGGSETPWSTPRTHFSRS